MNRSTPAKLARAERLERASPYARPENKVKRSTSMISFPGLRSLVSYMTYPFAKSPASKGLPITNGDIQSDQKSESGSEDGWNGEPSETMKGNDVFDLASASGRNGDEFEDRAGKWRARGEVAGGKRETARKSLEAAAIEPPLKSPVMPGHLTSTFSPPAASSSNGEGSLPSFGTAVNSFTNNLKRRLSPTKQIAPPPLRSTPAHFAPSTPVAPLQSSAQSYRAPPTATSASSIALKAFLDAKDGQPLDQADLRVIESLTDSARHESEAGSVKQATPLGGWAAGNFTPRSIRPLPSNTTPLRQGGSTFGTPIPAFSVGLSPPRSAASPGRFDSPGSVRYIGPGWSARRMYPQKKSGLKPLFNFNLEEEGITKKRRVDAVEGMDEDIPPVPPMPNLTSSMSMPNFASSSRTSGFKQPAKLPSPVKASPKQDSVSVGKKRAADIMLDLINAELGESKEQAKQPFIINPYHPDAHTIFATSAGSAPTSSAAPPPSPLRNGTPRKSILKQSTTNQTPLRGAAKRLEEAKNAAPSPSRLTSLDMLSAGSTSRADKSKKQPGRAVRIETPETEEEPSEVEEMIESPSYDRRRSNDQHKGPSSESEASPSGSPPKRAKRVEEPAPIKAYTAPQLSSNPLPLPNKAPSPSTFSFSLTPSNPSSEGLKPSAAPKFTPSPLSKVFMPEEPSFSLGTSEAAPRSPTKKNNLSKVYLSAKDTALAIAKEALPFFTFTFAMPTSTKESDSTKRAKEEAMKRPIAEFKFTLDTVSATPDSSVSTPAPTASSAGPWTCGLCMLQNPASALTECTICEAPRPQPSSSSQLKPAVQASTAVPSTGPWTCDLCMLQNPATAVEQCTICEAPKPQPKSTSLAPLFTFGSTAPATPAPAPAQTMSKGFDWSAAGGTKPESKSTGKWTCGTCMLDNPDSAKEKCQICEAARP